MRRDEAIQLITKSYVDWLNKQEREVLTNILSEDFQSYLKEQENIDLEVIAAINYKLDIDIEEDK